MDESELCYWAGWVGCAAVIGEAPTREWKFKMITLSEKLLNDAGLTTEALMLTDDDIEPVDEQDINDAFGQVPTNGSTQD